MVFVCVCVCVCVCACSRVCVCVCVHIYLLHHEQDDTMPIFMRISATLKSDFPSLALVALQRLKNPAIPTISKN